MTARGGIFQGNVLGSYDGVGVGSSLSGLGAIDIPYWCWDTDGFKAAHSACWTEANGQAAKWGSGDLPGACYGTSSKAECQQKVLDSCVSDTINAKCPWSQPPAGKNAVTSGGYAEGSACTSDAVVRHVQAMIGTSVDGKWGTNSRAALAKSGKTFKEWAPGCTGAAPNGGGGAVAPVTPAAPPATTAPPGGPVSKAGFLGLPTIAWAGVAGVALVLVLAANKKKAKG